MQFADQQHILNKHSSGHLNIVAKAKTAKSTWCGPDLAVKENNFVTFWQVKSNPTMAVQLGDLFWWCNSGNVFHQKGIHGIGLGVMGDVSNGWDRNMCPEMHFFFICSDQVWHVSKKGTWKSQVTAEELFFLNWKQNKNQCFRCV